MIACPSRPVSWDAAAYAANSAPQQSWARELMARLELRGDEHVLDVGCGDGKVTAEIAQAVPRGAVMGIDASAEMIAFAQEAFPPPAIPNLTFRVCDARKINVMLYSSPSPPLEERAGVRRQMISKREPLPPALSPPGRDEGEENPLFDVIFSNATLHWVDDHQAFLRGAAACLHPGGRLLISCGGQGNAHDVFIALRPEMRRKRWREFFRQLETPYFFYRPADYEKWLPRFGFQTREVKLSPKDAVHEGRDGLASWLRTTWLPYTQRVPENWREEFIAAVADRYLAQHPPDADGRVHVQMVRLEIDAERVTSDV